MMILLLLLLLLMFMLLRPLPLLLLMMMMMMVAVTVMMLKSQDVMLELIQPSETFCSYAQNPLHTFPRNFPVDGGSCQLATDLLRGNWCNGFWRLNLNRRSYFWV